MMICLWIDNLCRYTRHDKRSKLPGWILSHLREAHLNLSTDMAVHIARDVCHYCYFTLFLYFIERTPAFCLMHEPSKN